MLMMWLCQIVRELAEKNFIAALLVGNGLCGCVVNPTAWSRDVILIPVC